MNQKAKDIEKISRANADKESGNREEKYAGLDDTYEQSEETGERNNRKIFKKRYQDEKENKRLSG